MEPGSIWIGTSGWHYQHWVGRFYPAGMKPPAFLNYYAGRFRTVEINSTFYGLKSPESIARWCEEVPPGFLFACKANRYITHRKRLKEPEISTRRFFETVSVLGRSLGPILFQLPPFFAANTARLAEFLEAIPPGGRYAFEFRHDSWFNPEVYALLRRHNAALCAWDLNFQQSPVVETGDFHYIRLHGPGEAYRGEYPEPALRAWAGRLAEFTREGRDVYCYFDNDENAYAAFDALRLAAMVGQNPGKRLRRSG